MFIKVRLLNGFKEPLWYAADEAAMPERGFVGAVVQVPLQKRVTPAVVIHQQAEKPAVPFAIKAIERFEPFPADTKYWQFLEQLAAYHALEPAYLIQRLKGFLSAESIQAQVNYMHLASATQIKKESKLTAEQEAAYHAVREDLAAARYQATVLHGVTGSGKTEVYKKLMCDLYAAGKTTLFLVPEVTLAVNFYQRLKAQLPPTIPLYSFHSAVTSKEKRELWQCVLAGAPIVVIGVHLPLLLPVANLGLIIVDEEHEVGYQEKKYPYIHSKDAAVLRAHTYQVPVLLGSATPSLRSLYNVTHKKWRLCTLSQRYAGRFPRIQIVRLRVQQKRSNFWISRELEEAMRDRLRKKEQTILFLNRRGFSFFVQCGACGVSIQCHNCSVSLTHHEDEQLQCHYCGHTKQMPLACPSCKAPESQFLKKGVGTQKICSILASIFPEATIARADHDATKNKKNWQKTVESFYAGTTDILVGTQTITKGYDFPRVTLVGIIWADLNLHFPDYNATETTLQQLIQVAGRAGRHVPDSLVIVQTLSEHTVFSSIDELRYRDFCASEMQSRSEFGYPPYQHLCLIILQHTQATTVDRDSFAIATLLHTATAQYESSLQILGPSKPPVHKIQRVHVREIYLKAASMQEILQLYKLIKHTQYKSSILFMPGVV